MLILAKNRFIELLNGKNIVKKGGKYYTLKGVEVKPDAPLEEPKPKKPTAEKVEKDEHLPKED